MIEAVGGSDRQNREKMGQEDLLARSRILDLVTGQKEPVIM